MLLVGDFFVLRFSTSSTYPTLALAALAPGVDGVGAGGKPNKLESIAACAWAETDDGEVAEEGVPPPLDKSDGRRNVPCAIAAAANGICSN